MGHRVSPIEGLFPPPSGERHGCKRLSDCYTEPPARTSIPRLRNRSGISTNADTGGQDMSRRRMGILCLDRQPHRRFLRPFRLGSRGRSCRGMGRGERVLGGGALAVAERSVGDARKVEWDLGMFSQAGRGGQRAQPVREDSRGRPSVVELVGQRLVEHEFWDWLGLGGIEGHRDAPPPMPPQRVSRHAPHPLRDREARRGTGSEYERECLHSRWR